MTSLWVSARSRQCLPPSWVQAASIDMASGVAAVASARFTFLSGRSNTNVRLIPCSDLPPDGKLDRRSAGQVRRLHRAGAERGIHDRLDVMQHGGGMVHRGGPCPERVLHSCVIHKTIRRSWSGCEEISVLAEAL